MTTIQNMARQHKEFQSRLDDVERLWLDAQSSISKHQALDASLAKVESKMKWWKQEAKADEKKIELAEKEMDNPKQVARMARLTAVAAARPRQGQMMTLLESKMPWQLWRKIGVGWRLRLPV